MIRLFIYIALILSSLNAKELFTKEHITKYLTLENPFVYSAIGKNYIYKAKENYQLGNFDTKLFAKYDKKEYPLSYSEYVESGISKPIENGMEFSLAYRRAQGTQEYNNIKTSDDGEMQIGIKIPVFSVLNNMNERKLNLESSRLDTYRAIFDAQDKLRFLYYKVLTSYYKLLYQKESFTFVSQLLEKANKRAWITKKRVDAGSLPEIAYIEARQQIINREQRVLDAKNKYNNSLEVFVNYLNMDSNEFKRKYKLNSILELKSENDLEDITYKYILDNRADLKVLDTEIKGLNIQNRYIQTKRYPEFDIGVYGVHDIEYDSGFKITLGMSFPVERRKYKYKSIEIVNSIKNINMILEKKRAIIKTKLKTIANSIRTILQNIKNSEIELELVEHLENAENKKYAVGSSNLFILNQREIYTLQIKKKLLKYNLDYFILQQELDKLAGKSFDVLDK